MYRFVLRSTINIVSALLIMAVLLGGGFVLRLAWGPISLDALAPTIADELNARLRDGAPGWSFSLDGAGIRFDRETTRLRLVLRDVEVRAPDGGVAARAPALGFRVDPWRAIGGELVVNGVELIGAKALLRRTPEGRFRFAILDNDAAARALADRATDEAGARESAADAARPRAESDEEASAFIAVARVVEKLTDARNAPPVLSDFDELVISDLALDYEDATSGVVWRSRDARLVVTRGEEGARARLDAELETGPERPPVILAITGVRERDGEVIEMIADFENAATSIAAEQFPEFEPLERLSALAEGRVRARLDLEHGLVSGVSASISLGAGRIERIGGAPIAFESAEAAAAVDLENDRVDLERIALVGDGLALSGRGQLKLLRGEPAGDAPVGPLIGAEGRLTLGPGGVTHSAFVSTPLEIGGGRAQIAIAAPSADGPVDIRIDDLRLQVASTTFYGALSGRVEQGVLESAAFKLQADAFPATDLPKFLVGGAAPGARRWIEENIFAGRIEGLVASGLLRRPEMAQDLEATRLLIEFGFEELASRYVEGMTPITDGVGSARLDLESFTLDVESGHVDLGEAGRVELAGSRFAIPDIAADPTPSQIDLVVRGKTRALLTLLDQPPLGFVSRIGLDPAEMTGTVETDARLALPLIRDLPIEMVAASAEARLKRLSFRPAGLDSAVSFPEAKLVAGTSALTLEGDAAIDGVPLGLEWREIFSPGRGDARSVISFSGRFSDAALAERGVPVEALGLDGRTRVSGTVSLIDGRSPQLALTARLDGMAMAVPLLGWSKPAEARGDLKLGGSLGANGVADFSTLALEAPGLNAQGSLALGAGGGLERLALDRLEAGRTQAALTVEQAEGGKLSINITGAVLDLAPVLQKGGGGGGGGGGAGVPFDLRAEVGELFLTSKVNFEQARLVSSRESGGLRAEVTGQMRDGAARVTLTPDGSGGARYVATSDDAGDALRELGFVEDAHGGSIRVKGNIAADGSATGDFVIDNIVVKNAPVLAEILSVGTVIGAFDKFATGGISFVRVRGDFTVDENRLRILDAAASGPSIGMTMDGAIDRKSGKLDLAGSISPAFVLNGLISGVPIVGDILTGGDGQGILGFAYRVGGTQDSPSVSVNPLSALAPGPFRKIFTDTDAARSDRARNPQPPRPYGSNIDPR